MAKKFKPLSLESNQKIDQKIHRQKSVEVVISTLKTVNSAKPPKRKKQRILLEDDEEIDCRRSKGNSCIFILLAIIFFGIFSMIFINPKSKAEIIRQIQNIFSQKNFDKFKVVQHQPIVPITSGPIISSNDPNFIPQEFPSNKLFPRAASNPTKIPPKIGFKSHKTTTKDDLIRSHKEQIVANADLGPYISLQEKQRQEKTFSETTRKTQTQQDNYVIRVKPSGNHPKRRRNVSNN